ncbi:hypothetical protein [Saccharopolyspora sp. ASAGF58]|uniref:hypothetical protein n=1 Tax=Saccharopolyspora sp. ASAGF58 TaxID=2719023 RepID=UPI00143FEA20|nr:hypothetical protein [Saccharopolyspora sp. ASAGF58]QIZ33714.1 hypothetical protein FDZ84_01920 [Saccharopolyspora sp. ASAGF58]
MKPEDIATYLRASGWYEADHYNQATIWTHGPAGNETDVLAPPNNTFRDYPRRMIELLATVADVEQREPADVLQDLLSVQVDVQYIRTMPDSPSGTTPLHHGYQAVKGVHDLFLSAAASAHLPEPMAVLPSQKPPEAWDFIGGVRLGQTAPGSYIFRVETPLTGAGSPAGSPSRRVLDHLHLAMNSAHRAAADTDLPDGSRPFAEHIASGVSANLCEALSSIGALGNSAFEIKFAWAATLPMERPTPDLHFDTESISRIKKAGQYLRDLPAHREAQIEGRVVELRSYRPDKQGVVVIAGVLTTPQGRSTERVLVVLPNRYYELAHESHPGRKRVRAVGLVKTSGRQPELSAVTEFEVLED